MKCLTQDRFLGWAATVALVLIFGALWAGGPPDVPIESPPIFEAFPGTRFDPEEPSVPFQAPTNELIFPFFEADGTSFTGYAVTNLSSSEPAAVTVEAVDNEGRVLDTGFIEVPPQHQVAKLDREIFPNLRFETPLSGWVRMRFPVAAANLASFFQFGNGLSGTQLTQLDGGVAVPTPSTVLFFTRLHDGPRSFPTFGLQGPIEARTFISIVNPNDETITLRLRLFRESGQILDDRTNVSIPPFGRIREQLVPGLFPDITPETIISDGYARVDVTSGPGAVGFSWIEVEGGDTVIGVNASTGNTGDRLFSAQLATGTDQTTRQSIFTNLKVVNTSPNDSRSVILRPFRDDGADFSRPSFTLNPNNSATRQVFASELFNEGQSPVDAAKLTTGSILIELFGTPIGDAVIGDVLFGDPGDVNTGLTPDKVDFAAALSLQTQPFLKAVFSQVANGSANPDDPSTATFTGIALFNPNAQAASVTVEVFDREGSPVGEKILPLGANQRSSQLVEQIVPESVDLMGGYIVLTSDRPIVAQQLFGGRLLQFLSAVPPRIIE